MLLDRLTSFFRKFKAPPSETPLFGFAWYREEQWPLLLKVSTDAAQLEVTYDQWLKNAEVRYDELVRKGTRVEKVTIDVADMALWCRELGREVDSAGRSLYVVYRLREQKIAAQTPQALRGRSGLFR